MTPALTPAPSFPVPHASAAPIAPVALALFSGGLDSILAARLLMEQGVVVRCLHFVSPFFGKPDRVPHWREEYGLDIHTVDVGEEFADLLRKRPVYGFGSVLNPCVDCKILMMRRARVLLEETGACCIVSGEVLGQRPMSQRRDTLNVIARDAGIKGLLLRPLSALHQDPTQVEQEGVVDRQRLLGICGRGRKEQMALAARMGITEIPTPAGGCRLAEQENARAYWPVLRCLPKVRAADFSLANTGRQFWYFPQEQMLSFPAWLCVGRNQADNDRLMELARPDDVLIKVRDFAGPVALLRFAGETTWEDIPQKDMPDISPDILPDILKDAASLADSTLMREAAALMASYSPKAVRYAAEYEGAVAARVHLGSLDGPGCEIYVTPVRAGTRFAECSWEQTREEIRAEARARER